MSETTLVVGPAGLWDAEALGDVAAATFPLACPPGTAPEDIETFLAAMLSAERFGEYLGDPDRVVLRAAEDGEIVGYAMLHVGTPEDPAIAEAVELHPAVELSKLYVLPGRHGSGVAAALLRAALEHAAAAGGAGIWLGVNQHNARAQRFYARSGFERCGTKTFRVGAELHDDFIMRLRF
ncbi:GNAT family N-acetyltransferase [Nocardia asteroides]|uniref:GNAT family N-acetyltransferase n=1 Tax=Nocardia asteroides TaxID=1824 RepID=UPI001E3F2C7E|nr:GNAT family N-acetyltransferase [Nocardia asteroides]UGT63422.1 GNAT family N-acetyltransferase [Nocardia asteroides]